jgi:hypothetical protein
MSTAVHRSPKKLDPDPAIFVINLQDANKKLLLKKYFCVLLFEGTFTSFIKDKKSKEVTKQQFYLIYYFCLMKIRIHTSDKRIRIQIQKAQKHMDPMDPDSDPDSQH